MAILVQVVPSAAHTASLHRSLHATCMHLFTNPFLSKHDTTIRYLFQPDKPYAELDTGDMHVMCGRRNDIMKFWLSWQVLGVDGYNRRCVR